jgi:hypothetical protein
MLGGAWTAVFSKRAVLPGAQSAKTLIGAFMTRANGPTRRLARRGLATWQKRPTGLFDVRCGYPPGALACRAPFM